MWTCLKELIFGKKSSVRTMPKQGGRMSKEDGRISKQDGGVSKTDKKVESVEEVQVEKELARKELPLIEEVKTIFGDYGKLFTCGKEKDAHGNDLHYIVSDYVDDEGMKELLIKEIPNYPNMVLVSFRLVMKPGTFNISDLITIKRAVEQQVPNGNLTYYNLEHSMNFVFVLNRDSITHEDEFAEMVMKTIWGLEVLLTNVMPNIRLQYDRF